MKKDKKPSIGRAFEKDFEAKIEILKTLWPFLVIFFGGVFVLIGMEINLKGNPIVPWLVAIAVIVNIAYYIWARRR
jgi:hypothetical protein